MILKLIITTFNNCHLMVIKKLQDQDLMVKSKIEKNLKKKKDRKITLIN